MDNQILKVLMLNQLNHMRIDVLDLHSLEMSSWFLSEYKIRADNKTMRIYGKDKDLSYHWIDLIRDKKMFSRFMQDDIFDMIKFLQFTYKDRYKIEIKIQTTKKKAEVIGETSTFKQTYKSN